MSAWHGGAGEVLGSVGFWSESGLVESGLSNQLCLPWLVITSCHVPMGDDMRRLHNTFCERPCVSIPLFLVHLPCFSLRCEYKIRGLHKIQLHSHFEAYVHTTCCTFIWYAVFDFFLLLVHNHRFKQILVITFASLNSSFLVQIPITM